MDTSKFERMSQNFPSLSVDPNEYKKNPVFNNSFIRGIKLRNRVILGTALGFFVGFLVYNPNRFYSRYRTIDEHVIVPDWATNSAHEMTIKVSNQPRLN